MARHKLNGWKRATAIAAFIVAIGGAGIVLEPYVKLPWAPPIAFVWASENTIARLDNQLFTYEVLLQQAHDRKDAKAIRRQSKNVKDTQRKIDEVEAAIKREKK